MNEVTKVFLDFRQNKKAMEACLAMYGVLVFRKVVTDAKQGPNIFTFENEFKNYATMLKTMEIADASIQLNQYRIEPREDGDFDLYVQQAEHEGLGAVPWVLLIMSLIVAYGIFKLSYEGLAQAGRKQEQKYQEWFSTLPDAQRRDVMAMEEHSRANAAVPGIVSQLGKGAMDVGIGVAIALGAILLFKWIGDTRKEGSA